MGLAPTLLLSMPQLVDPNFARTVVLLCEHAPEGAFGLVLNRPTGVTAASVVRLDPPIAEGGGLTLWMGGPVEPQRGWILLGDQSQASDARRIADGVYLSASPVLLRRVLEERPAPRARVLAGYAGLGTRTARQRAGRVFLAHRRRPAGSDLRHRPRRHVGNGHPPPRRRSHGAPDEPRRALRQA